MRVWKNNDWHWLTTQESSLSDLIHSQTFWSKNVGAKKYS